MFDWLKKWRARRKDRREHEERRKPSVVSRAGSILWFPIKWLIRALVASVVLLALAVLGYVYLPQVINQIDAWNPQLIDKHAGTSRESVMLLHQPEYYAEQTDVISENQQKVACISSPVHRVKVTDPGDIPDLVRKAIVASEDKTFFEHDGFDRIAFLRAGLNAVRGKSSSGASTLPMQIAKDLRHGTGRRSTLKEKIADVITAIRIDREFSKEQLLLKYVNMPYFGRGQYGIEAASRAYFGKPAKELATHQIAFLVSLINKPALPDRSFSNDRAARTPEEIKSANWQEVMRGTRRVLDRMAQEGYLAELAEARASEAVDRTLRKEVLPVGIGCGANDYYLEYVRMLYKDQFPLNKGGLKIAIPRDDGLQDVLAKAVKTTVAKFKERHLDDLDNDELRACAFAIQFNGDVLAWVGNVDFKKYKFDVCGFGWRSPGSTIKPFTYAAFVQKLVADALLAPNPPETIDDIVAQVLNKCTVLDAPVAVGLGRGRGKKWIQNFHSNSEPLYRGNISCQLALGESRNAAAMRAGKQGGIKEMIELIYLSGMPKDARHIQQPYPTTAIGGSDVRPIGMAGVASFVNGGFKMTPRFVNDLCKDDKSLLSKENDGLPRECDVKGENHPPQERIVHPAVAGAMVELLKAPADLPTGTVHRLRLGVIPGLDPLGEDINKLKPEERKSRLLAFPFEQAGEIAGKTGTATNADGRTSDVWLLLFVPGPLDHPEKGIMLVFWMGKDSKDHPLGERGTHGGGGYAETGGRNWTPSAGAVLAFLQKERGLLKPGNRFQPIYKDDVLLNFEAKKAIGPNDLPNDPDEVQLIDPSDPTTDPKELEDLPPLPPEEQVGPPQPQSPEGEKSAPSVPVVDVDP